MKTKTYDFIGTHGIDDLYSLSPYYGEWAIFNSAFPDIDEDTYKKDPKAYEDRIKLANEITIKKLKEKNLYLKHYVVQLSLVENPLYDNNTVDIVSENPKESYRMIFLNGGSE